MSTPRILGPDGVSTINRADAVEAGTFAISTNFDLQTGRGTVKVRIPHGVNTAQLGADIATHLLKETTNISTEGWGAVVKGILDAALPHLMVELLPNEARVLGMKLMQEAETAVGNAITMRMLLELFSVPPQDAVGLLNQISQGTREDHALVFEHLMNARKQRRQMDSGDDTPRA